MALNTVLDAIATAKLNLPLLAAFVLFSYFCYVSIYRLWLSPIANFPGPKLAAVTFLYEQYYNIWLSGQFAFQIIKLHDEYGPIVRINPNEISIRDEGVFNDIYTNTVRFDKYQPHLNWSPSQTSTESTASHSIHRLRRAPLNPYFSKRAIADLAPQMKGHLEDVLTRLRSEYMNSYSAGHGKVLNLNAMWVSYTCDTITKYCFAWSYDTIHGPDFATPIDQAISDGMTMIHILTHFPFLLTLIGKLPEFLRHRLAPGVKASEEFNQRIKDTVRDIVSNQKPDDSAEKRILSRDLINSFQPEQAQPNRVADEFLTILAAGLETTKWALCLACFYIYSRQDVYDKLYEELVRAIPDPHDMPSVAELEKLEYLDAVIKESLRLQPGVGTRLARVLPSRPFTYQPSAYAKAPNVDAATKAWEIPPGTPFSMSNLFMNFSDTLFPEPKAFRPERWLGDPVSPIDGKPLGSFIASFSKGSRICLGQDLALAELYLGLATFVRRVKMDVLTPVEDLEYVSEHFVMVCPASVQGIKVSVKEVI